MSDVSQKLFPAKVVAVIGYDRLVFNRGTSHGIKKGQRFLVYALGKELFDPETAETLGQLELVRGSGVAVHVQDRLTTLQSDSRSPNTKRVIRRPEWMISGRMEEVIEETGETLPFEDPAVGDLVRPL